MAIPLTVQTNDVNCAWYGSLVSPESLLGEQTPHVTIYENPDGTKGICTPLPGGSIFIEVKDTIFH